MTKSQISSNRPNEWKKNENQWNTTVILHFNSIITFDIIAVFFLFIAFINTNILKY